jgi:aminoglycoside/choline kinase family phosphotransferase
MTSAMDQLSERQRELLGSWLPGVRVERDHSWGLVGTTVLEVTSDGSRFIVKAGDERDHHLARELRAHREWLAPWTTLGRAPRLAFADGDAKVLVTQHLPGSLVQGHPAAHVPETYRQAGDLLRRLHTQSSVTDHGHEARENARSLAWLDKPHRVAPAVEAALRAEIASWPTPASVLVPTHGDWQPRNWLVHEGTIGIIDFGRADLRPALTDFARLAAQDFARDPALEAAFLEGYGDDPREPGAWHRARLREAIGTAAWAHQVGDSEFEAHGHRMIAELLAG